MQAQQGIPCKTLGLYPPPNLVCKSGMGSREHNLGSQRPPRWPITPWHTCLRGWRRTMKKCGWNRSQPRTKLKWDAPKNKQTTGLCRWN